MDQKRKLILKKFGKRIKQEIKDYHLLNMAFTHPTYVFEHPKINLISNQRLEFLGDAVLGMVIAKLLYTRYPDNAEGELTKMRAALVCETSLAEIARTIALGDYLLLGKGEEQSGGRERVSILADALEAVIGALFLQVDLEKLIEFIHNLFKPQIDKIEVGSYGDYKTNLQELVQKKNEDNVSYIILEESGPDHNKRFVAGVIFQDVIIATGQGKSKKEAEQKAAQKALEATQWLSMERCIK
ncbi:MAG: ribonuclease III [Clostridia bacterium]|nr:ribonuclease III [Clostridia bacterium]